MRLTYFQILCQSHFFLSLINAYFIHEKVRFAIGAVPLREIAERFHGNLHIACLQGFENDGVCYYAFLVFGTIGWICFESGKGSEIFAIIRHFHGKFLCIKYPVAGYYTTVNGGL